MSRARRGERRARLPLPLPRASVALAALLLLVHVGANAWRAPAAGDALTFEQIRLRLDPNTATLAELQLLPRIGPQLAANIIAYRESVTCRPAFRRAEDLDRVMRIGPVTVERLREYWDFSHVEQGVTIEQGAS